MNALQHLIYDKVTSSEPEFATFSDILPIHTEVNQTPYPYFFRGDYLSSEPQIFNRQAGWTPTNIPCKRRFYPEPKPCVEFQAPCSTTFTKVCEKHKEQVYQNDDCIVLYR